MRFQSLSLGCITENYTHTFQKETFPDGYWEERTSFTNSIRNIMKKGFANSRGYRVEQAYETDAIEEEIKDDGLGTKTVRRKDLRHKIETVHIDEVASQRVTEIETGPNY